MLGERLHHGRPLADGAEDGLPLDIRMVLLKLKIDRVEIEFAAVYQHELAWAERGDLAHQLASYRSSGACHQHPPAMDRLAHHFAVEQIGSASCRERVCQYV